MHCHFDRTDAGELRLTDVSTNGTFVNRKRVPKHPDGSGRHQTLREGDVVRLVTSKYEGTAPLPYFRVFRCSDDEARAPEDGSCAGAHAARADEPHSVPTALASAMNAGMRGATIAPAQKRPLSPDDAPLPTTSPARPPARARDSAGWAGASGAAATSADEVRAAKRARDEASSARDELQRQLAELNRLKLDLERTANAQQHELEALEAVALNEVVRGTADAARARAEREAAASAAAQAREELAREVDSLRKDAAELREQLARGEELVAKANSKSAAAERALADATEAQAAARSEGAAERAKAHAAEARAQKAEAACDSQRQQIDALHAQIAAASESLTAARAEAAEARAQAGQAQSALDAAAARHESELGEVRGELRAEREVGAGLRDEVERLRHAQQEATAAAAEQQRQAAAASAARTAAEQSAHQQASRADAAEQRLAAAEGERARERDALQRQLREESARVFSAEACATAARADAAGVGAALEEAHARAARSDVHACSVLGALEAATAAVGKLRAELEAGAERGVEQGTVPLSAAGAGTGAMDVDGAAGEALRPPLAPRARAASAAERSAEAEETEERGTPALAEGTQPHTEPPPGSGATRGAAPDARDGDGGCAPSSPRLGGRLSAVLERAGSDLPRRQRQRQQQHEQEEEEEEEQQQTETPPAHASGDTPRSRELAATQGSPAVCLPHARPSHALGAELSAPTPTPAAQPPPSAGRRGNGSDTDPACGPDGRSPTTFVAPPPPFTPTAAAAGAAGEGSRDSGGKSRAHSAGVRTPAGCADAETELDTPGAGSAARPTTAGRMAITPMARGHGSPTCALSPLAHHAHPPRQLDAVQQGALAGSGEGGSVGACDGARTAVLPDAAHAAAAAAAAVAAAEAAAAAASATMPPPDWPGVAGGEADTCMQPLSMQQQLTLAAGSGSPPFES